MIFTMIEKALSVYNNNIETSFDLRKLQYQFVT